MFLSFDNTNTMVYLSLKYRYYQKNGSKKEADEYLKNNIGYLLYGSAIFAAIQLLDLILIKNNLPNAET
jgi:hypothetical protein